MAEAWAYTKSTNTAVVTGGTSGTPSTFGGFVTADRAGSVTLLAAWAPNSNTKALTYQITPVEKLALLISLIVTLKTTETDYVFVTGTDAWDAAQTEAVNVSAGNGTYVTTKKFRTITNIDCSDSATGGGTVWADGKVAVTQAQWGVIWNNGNGQYRIDCILNIGDASTATYLTTKTENIVFPTLRPYVLANATFQMGELDAVLSKGQNGSEIRAVWLDAAEFCNGGTVYLYSSKVCQLGTAWANTEIVDNNGSTLIAKDSIIESSDASALRFGRNGSVTTNLDNVIINLKNPDAWVVGFGPGSHTLSGLIIHQQGNVGSYTPTGIAAVDVYATINLVNPLIIVRSGMAHFGTIQWDRHALTTFNFINPNLEGASPICDNKVYDATGSYDPITNLQYYCDIHVADKDGVNLASATVLCQDASANTVFSVSTDANGNITQQTITYKSWVGDADVLTTYSPHKFTISKAGYQALVLDAITVDHPVVWHLELQQPVGGGAALKMIGVGVGV